jgi:hypothetical protein
VALLAFVLFFAGLRLARPRTVFYYTEGPVLGSLAALEARGDLSDLYPADGWDEPPLVLTLYPPIHFLLAAGVDRVAGTGGTFVGLRIVSLAALVCVLLLVAWHARLWRAPPTWLLALGAAVLVTPAVYRVVAGAQVDVLALAFTWMGIAAVLSRGEANVREEGLALLAAGAAFLLAFFSKQSFVAAPAAVVVALWLAKRARTAVLFGGGLALFAVLGAAALNVATSGGYLANTLGALTGSSSWANLVESLRESRPLQWLPIVAVVLVSCRRNLRLGFPELYLIASAALHTAAMLKTGSSSNYFLEPMFALLLVAATRWPEESATAPGRRARSRRTVSALLAAVILVPAVIGAVREYRTLGGWLASGGSARVSEFEGLPLVDAHFFPAILERGGRPWLNDPLAFGALEETGQWDPSRLVGDLEERRIPFALTAVDLSHGPAPAGVGTRELVLAYFWRSPRVWTALTKSYSPLASGPVTVWLPAEEETP